jgi:hypothetical protein
MRSYVPSITATLVFRSNLVSWENDVSDNNLEASAQFVFTLQCAELGPNSAASKRGVRLALTSFP